MNTKLGYLHHVFQWCLFGFLAVLSISGTIALRNVLHLALLLIFLWFLVFARERLAYSPVKALRWVPLPLLVWIAFLVLFPLWAVQTNVAWFNLRGQWMESILTWVLAFGAILILGKQGPSLWVLSWVSAVPTFLHLVLTLLKWIGFFGRGDFTSLSLDRLWEIFVHLSSGSVSLNLGWGPFPMGFRGIEEMHGNIGYVACQTIALASVSVALAFRGRDIRKMWGSILLIVLSFASVLIAASRGAVYFAFLLLALGVILFIVSGKKQMTLQAVAASKNNILAFVGIAITFLACLGYLTFGLVKNDLRWYSMWDKIELGLMNDNPIETLCNGLSPKVRDQLHQKFEQRNPVYVQELIAGLEGQDGGRVLLMRAGMHLVLENPQGLDGSRQSYEKLMVEKCGHTPSLKFSHAHQAWINLTLALGWLGGLLFALMMFYFLWVGWINLAQVEAWHWGMALFLIAIFWIIRGFTDAVYQEHYLQMQAFFLLYFYYRISLQITPRFENN